MITTKMTAVADAAAQRYGILVESWRSLFKQALMSRDFGSQRVLRRTISEAYAVARTFLDTEQVIVAAETQQIAQSALQQLSQHFAGAHALTLSDAALELLSESEAYLLQELSIQIERDIAFLRKSLVQTALQVSIAASSQDISFQTALIQYRIGNVAELHFFFHDRGSQKWPSRKFVRAVWRHHLLNAYNEITLLTLAEHGIETASIQHLNPKAEVNGMVLAMSAHSELPTYAEIRNDIFHPNSDAILTHPEAA